MADFRSRHCARSRSSCCCRFLPASCCKAGSAAWCSGTARCLGLVDRGSVLLMVYTVFSAATVGGIWHQLTLGRFALLVAVDAACWRLMLATTALAARRLGFSRADEIAIVFCGSKKSLVSGIPMANVLFAGPASRADRLAVDDLPPAPADGLRGPRPALRKSRLSPRFEPELFDRQVRVTPRCARAR